MTREQYAKKKLPDAPGVYFFLGKRREILYIGRATSLRSRTRSYFDDDLIEKRSPLIERIVCEAKTLDYTVTDSVLEAIIMEANLIRIHKPRGNTDLKDDKSFNHLVITNEDFPRVLIVRGKDITEKFEEKELLHCFGPFTSGGLLKEALKIVRKIFQFYDTKHALGTTRSRMERGKIAFNQQIGLYPSQVTKEEYRRTIRRIALLFQGKKQALIRELRRDMMRHAKAREFEEAERLKRQIFALLHIQDIALLKEHGRQHLDERHVRIEGYDVAHISGSDMVGVMTVVERGEMARGEYRKFKIQTVTGANDPAALSETLDRRLGHSEWNYPQIIVVDGNAVQKRAAEAVLRKYEIHIPVVAVVKDEFHRPKRIIGPESLVKKHEEGILLVNAEAHRFSISYHRQKRGKSMFGR